MTETTREFNPIDTNGHADTAAQIRLNLGCGRSWHADGWFGIDQRSGSGTWHDSREPYFFDLDLKRGLPFPANSVDVVFSSHALEQFTHEEALALLFEIHRVLKVGAPLCLVVADLDTYIRNYIERNEAFLTAPEIIGGSPRDNLTDNFLMTFYADPRFDNTGHKYAYNFENLSSTLRLVGFEQIQKVSYHDFSYWPELRGAEFRSPMKAFERFSLSAQCRKVRHDPNFRARAEFRQAITYARSNESEHQPSNGFTSALFTNEQTRSLLGPLTEKIDGLELALRQSKENEAALTQELAALRNRANETQQPNHKALRALAEAAEEHKEMAAELDRQRKRSGELERSKRVHEANWRAFRESIPQLTKRLAQAVLDWPRTRRRDRMLHRLISTSDWFDAAWYKSTYPDVAQSGADPAWHYLRHGAAEGRNPSPRFNTNLYLALYPDVERAGVNPLAHFVQFGIAERRCPAHTS